MGVKVQSEWQTFQVIQFLTCILGICLKISINRGQMRYCCSISIKIWGNQYPEISSVRRSTPDHVIESPLVHDVVQRDDGPPAVHLRV